MSSGSQANRDAHSVFTGEKQTEETILGVSVERGDSDHHVQTSIEKQASLLREDEIASRRSSVSSITDSISKAIRKSRKTVKKLAPPRPGQPREPEWLDVEKGLAYLHEKDAEVLRAALEAASRNADGGKLYFRKIHTGSYGEFVEWQVKFDHKTRGCQEQARALKDAARKVKSYLEFAEPAKLDERFNKLREIIRNDKRYDGALILFKEGKKEDWFPWKLRIQHNIYGWTTVSATLPDAITAMEEHLEYELATPEIQEGTIWERVFNELERYSKSKVFFKGITEPGPDGEPETVWLMKVDHPTRGIQFEAKSRILEEAAGQVYDYLAEKSEDDTRT